MCPDGETMWGRLAMRVGAVRSADCLTSSACATDDRARSFAKAFKRLSFNRPESAATSSGPGRANSAATVMSRKHLRPESRSQCVADLQCGLADREEDEASRAKICAQGLDAGRGKNIIIVVLCNAVATTAKCLQVPLFIFWGGPMDEVLVSVYRQLVLRTRASADDILEDPDLRKPFVDQVRKHLGEHLPERQLLHRLSYLRKCGRLPRSREIS